MGQPQFRSTKLAPGERRVGEEEVERWSTFGPTIPQAAAGQGHHMRRGALLRSCVYCLSLLDCGAAAWHQKASTPPDPPASLAIFAAATPSEIWLVAIWTPKHASFGALTNLARSTRSPLAGQGRLGRVRHECRMPWSHGQSHAMSPRIAHVHAMAAPRKPGWLNNAACWVLQPSPAASHGRAGTVRGLGAVSGVGHSLDKAPGKRHLPKRHARPKVRAQSVGSGGKNTFCCLLVH